MARPLNVSFLLLMYNTVLGSTKHKVHKYYAAKKHKGKLFTQSLKFIKIIFSLHVKTGKYLAATLRSACRWSLPKALT